MRKRPEPQWMCVPGPFSGNGSVSRGAMVRSKLQELWPARGRASQADEIERAVGRHLAPHEAVTRTQGARSSVGTRT